MVIDVIGVAAAGWDSLGPAERDLVLGADLLLGGHRHLEMVPPVEGQRRIGWPTDLRESLPRLLSGHESATIVVLASGDPLVAGVGTTILDVAGSAAVRIHPAVSSVALARARMGWSDDTVEVIRLRGDDLDVIRRSLFPHRRLLILSRDGNSPAEIAGLLREGGFEDSLVTVLGDLGTAGESSLVSRAAELSGPAPELNIVCVECGTTGAGTWSLAAGLPDGLFEHDGQLTKRDLRASALAHLLPRPGDLLWDVGAGAGSVAVEWLRSHPSCRAVAVEHEPSRVGLIRLNAKRLGVPSLQIVQGAAPEALAELPRPDAVFVGGGASAETLSVSWAALMAGGRMVVHAVTNETEMEVTDCWRRYGGELIRILVERLQPLGSYHGWKPSRAVVQWSAAKPLDAP
jgi:precorrin-6Y C5,15-methyltransferase (decarboxylating)